MSRRRKKVAMLAIVVVAAVAVAFVWPREKEPEYKGKKLSQWLRPAFNGSEPTADAIEAVRAMGTNALPDLLKKIAYQDSPGRNRFIVVAQKVPNILGGGLMWRLARGDGNEVAFAAAELGFQALGTNAASAVPALTLFLDHTNEDVCRRAITALSWVGPEGLPPLLGLARDENYASRMWATLNVAEAYHRNGGAGAALPMLIEWAAEQDERFGGKVADLAGNLREDPRALEVLVGLMTHSNYLVRLTAVRMLGRFREKGSNAVPAVVAALNDRAFPVRTAATNTLGWIAPEVLTNGASGVHSDRK